MSSHTCWRVVIQNSNVFRVVFQSEINLLIWNCFEPLDWFVQRRVIFLPASYLYKTTIFRPTLTVFFFEFCRLSTTNVKAINANRKKTMISIWTWAERRNNVEPDTMAIAIIPITMHSRNIKIATNAVHSTIDAEAVTSTNMRIGFNLSINGSIEMLSYFYFLL